MLFFSIDTATTEIYTLSLHDALPIFGERDDRVVEHCVPPVSVGWSGLRADRKSTRLNSSHVKISYAVFCLKKKNLKIESFIALHGICKWRRRFARLHPVHYGHVSGSV